MSIGASAFDHWNSPTSQRYATTMWRHYRTLRRIKVTDLRTSFQAWFQTVRHRRMHQAMMMHTRQQKRHKFQEQMRSAAQADATHDQRQLHTIVRSSSPKQPIRQIRFRSSTGLAQSPEAELEVIRTHFAEVYCGSAPTPPRAPCHQVNRARRSARP